MVREARPSAEAATPEKPKNNIKSWREYRGFKSHGDLAAVSGVSRPTIWRLETGAQPYRQEQLEKLAAVLNCTPMELVEVNPYEDFAIYQVFAKLGKRQKRRAVRALQQIAGIEKPVKSR